MWDFALVLLLTIKKCFVYQNLILKAIDLLKGGGTSLIMMFHKIFKKI